MLKKTLMLCLICSVLLCGCGKKEQKANTDILENETTTTEAVNEQSEEETTTTKRSENKKTTSTKSTKKVVDNKGTTTTTTKVQQTGNETKTYTLKIYANSCSDIGLYKSYKVNAGTKFIDYVSGLEFYSNGMFNNFKPALYSKVKSAIDKCSSDHKGDEEAIIDCEIDAKNIGGYNINSVINADTSVFIPVSGLIGCGSPE